MKIFLDLFPFAAFVLVLSKFGIYPATAVLIGTLWLALLIDYFLVSKKLNIMLLVGAVLASVFGGLTLAFHNPMFIHIKPTVLYGLNALVFLGSHYIGDKVLLQRLMGGQLPLPTALWRKMSAAWVVYLLICASVNAVAAFAFNQQVWAYTLIGIKVSIIPFMLAHFPFLAPHLKDAEPPGA